jgi:hypothetical protein
LTEFSVLLSLKINFPPEEQNEKIGFSEDENMKAPLAKKMLPFIRRVARVKLGQ